ncbi:MAG TPA: PAS domain-containing sensor histidine kinase [Flavisolibacter sp.]|jgi:PAS domain S-box-containing protein
MELDLAHMTSLFQNATEGLVITNSQGLIILINPSACRMFQYEEEELIGQPIELLIPASYRKQHVELREQFYKDPKNRVMGHGRDLNGERKDGTPFPVEVSLSTYLHKAQRYAIAFIVDITHRKEIEQNMLRQQQALETVTTDLRKLNIELEAKVEERTTVLKEALDRLEHSQAELSEALDKERQLNEIKGRFVSMASHEFRTPLSTVLSSASLLSKYTGVDEQDKRLRHIDKIKGAVKHLNDLLEDFLSLGKLEEGKIGVSLQPFNLDEVLQDTVDEMKALAKEAQSITCRSNTADTIVSDKKLVKYILINLLSNAIKFSGEEALIVVSKEVKAGTASITVQDEGIGISPEDQEHLFSSFFRGRNALNIQGTGLGLHIVKRYVDLLHGSISVQSEPGKGTAITFIIPALQQK